MARAVQRAYETIRTSILSGAHAEGDHLGEADLAGVIGVSRTPVREALRRLDAEGLVEFSANRGAKVAELSDDDLEEIFGLRALLESYGARLAAPRIDRLDIERMRDLCERMEATTDLDEIAEHNNVFHRTILGAAGNRRLVGLLTAVVQVPLVHRTFHRYTPQALARSLAHHRELVAALEARDGPWAESVMRSHVFSARAALTESGGGGP